MSRDDPEEPADHPVRQRLSLEQDIDYLRAQFLRLAIFGAKSIDPVELGTLVRNLSFAATAITRLIHTEGWLSQATGSQVQYTQLDQAVDTLRKVTHKAHPKPKPEPEIPIQDPELERLYPGIHFLSQQLGMPLDLLGRAFNPERYLSIDSGRKK